MRIFLSFFLLITLFACKEQLVTKKFLVIYSNGSSLPTEHLTQFLIHCQKKNIEVDTTDQTIFLNKNILSDYSAVWFMNIPGKNLNFREHTAIERYVQAGGGIVGVGTDLKPNSIYDWPWYSELSKPSSKTGNEIVQFLDAKNPSENTFKQTSLIYNGGKVSFLENITKLSDEELDQIINFTIGENTIDYSLSTSLSVPDDNRFTRIVLDDDINEPMELDITKEGKVIFIEREGKIKMYDPSIDKTKVLANIEVCTEGNYEDGILGLAIDPDYENNGWLYLYYSPPCIDSVLRLSRFFMSGDSLLLSSERVILDIPVQRETCCHSGGSLQFTSDNILFLSTGDNTSSKESDGYTPIDERPGRSPFDAQKSSGNTHDLRGKILRLKINKDATYSIPDGNLFPKDGSEGKPEIYVMGARNPFRISVDPKTGFLYWGDVGPDSGVDGPQGPQSYDEFNQARQPGNYGWPYFVGNNIAYPDFDFTTNTPGPYFDPLHPVNESPNNTGAKELPPAQLPIIWYPYSQSNIFPVLGQGSRSAMAGPVYYTDQYRDSGKNFPKYYDGKLFIYEWARSWILAVSFDENHNVNKIEPFLKDMELSKPIEMEFGPDGAMYFLEYGANYFANNEDARLVKIEYAEGNRLPIPRISIDKSVGAAPFTVNFSAAESFDYDENDQLSYAWIFEGEEIQSTEIECSYTFQTVGTYQPKLIITDNNGDISETSIEIKVGNEPPAIDVKFSGNSSFFFEEDSKLPYEVIVSDKEDGSLTDGGINPNNVAISFDYLPFGKDLALISGKNLVINRYLKGKNLMNDSDCKSCHSLDKASIGPSYTEIANRYKMNSQNITTLGNKIITGGNGNWGHSLMAAHPQHSLEETEEMVKYILSLNKDGSIVKTIPLKGELSLDKHQTDSESGTYFLSIGYKDKGSNGIDPLSNRKTIAIRHPKIEAEEYENFKFVARQRPSGGNLSYISIQKSDAFISFKDIDLSDIGKISYNLNPRGAGGVIELRIDSIDGSLISEVIVESQNTRDFIKIQGELTPTIGKHDLFFVFKNKDGKRGSLFNLDWIYFQKNSKTP